ncbi:sodium hydrogen exchanger [Stylonychia lemnae]|uniref:Sodium/hydrogen exchanger n=1 Tax=Stylonychia lemnae TaxID=5949 RepID=A0A077ZPH1_STYLE|nr:sodium hydrogen exchanger [Stylonychia lemnae]|eukprot:CDW71290.1 sodium hydrogen exchanger [Stylonychia lemnae]
MSEHSLSSGAILIVLLIMFYMFIGSVIERYKIIIGHEAALAILLGMLVSFLAFKLGHVELTEFLTFNENFFFYFCLPPLVFASGYNMQRKNFFDNFNNILIFGLVNTVIQFTLFSVFTWLMFKYQTFYKYHGETGTYEQFELSIFEILLMCSLLCSSDVVAAVSLINSEKQPKLFSLVFGEGVTNDAISIILFNAVVQFTAPGNSFTATTPLKIFYSFLILGFFSLFIGIFVALLGAFVTKHCRFLTVKPVIECNFIFCFGYLAYTISERCEMSGIISLLACGILLAKYCWYNLSPQSKQTTSLAFSMIGYAAEAFVFGYLGLTFFSYVTYEWSWQLFIGEVIVVLIGRFSGTIGLIKFLELFGYKSGIGIRELTFISYAGMIRGAVAFGLVLRIDKDVPNRSVIVTTSLGLVVFTTVFMGSTVALIQRCLFGKEIASEPHQEEHNNDGKSGHENSHHEIVEHPNLQESKVPYETQNQKSGQLSFTDKIRRFDQEKMKPFLIYKYAHLEHKRQKEYNQMLMNQGEELERHYVKHGSLRGSIGVKSQTSQRPKLSSKMRYFGSSDNLYQFDGLQKSGTIKQAYSKRASIIQEEQELKNYNLDDETSKGAKYSLLKGNEAK